LGGHISTQAFPGSLHLTKLELAVNRKTAKALGLAVAKHFSLAPTM
jgi:hypothetical protein